MVKRTTVWKDTSPRAVTFGRRMHPYFGRGMCWQWECWEKQIPQTLFLSFNLLLASPSSKINQKPEAKKAMHPVHMGHPPQAGY